MTRVGGWAAGLDGPQYVVSPDGLRFLMSTVTGEVMTSSDHGDFELEAQAVATL